MGVLEGKSADAHVPSTGVVAVYSTPRSVSVYFPGSDRKSVFLRPVLVSVLRVEGVGGRRWKVVSGGGRGVR